MRRPLAKASDRSRWARSTSGLRHRRPVAVLLLACGLLLVSGGGVSQAAPKGTVGFIGSAGSGAGEFSTPSGVAVNQSTGHVYVVDTGNNRVQQFGPTGFVRAWGWGVRTGAAAFEVCDAPAPCLPGTPGAAAGQLSSPQGIAVDGDGNVYVTSQSNRRIEKFDEEGQFLFAFGWGVDTGAAAVERCTAATGCQASPSGSNGGQFFGTLGSPFNGHLAIDPRNENVVVADPGNRRVQRFDSEGTFLDAFGWGVDTGAPALETCTTASGCARGTAGTGDGQFSNNQPIRVAVDAAGSVYTVEGTAGRRVQKFNAAASSSGVFAPEHTTGTSNDTAPTNVAVNPANGHVLVAKDRQVLEFDIVGALTETHVAGAGLPAANGMAVDGTNDRIYLTTTPDHRVFVLGAVTPPSATIAPTQAVTATTATFHGTVNPNNGALSTSYHFEYSDDGGLTWTLTEDHDVGDGTDDEDAVQPVTGLEPNTQYRVRLVASRPFGGGSATSATIPDDEGNPVPVTFTTNPAPPSISGVDAVEVTDTTAVLAGRIDPNRSHTTYRFEYGTDTSYGNATPLDSAGSGPAGVPVSKPITGLQPNTTYHFRLVATNAAGETHGPDGTFTTVAQPPQPNGRAYEMVSPVDKNGGDIARDLNLQDYNHQTGASASGNAVAFVSRVGFGDLESSPAFFPNYAARRDSSGWTTEGITPPIAGPADGTENPAVLGLSLDTSKAFVVAAPQLTPDAATLNGSWGLYMESIGQPAERYRLASVRQAGLVPDPPDATSNFRTERFEYEASTPDARHVVFNSTRRLLQHAPDGVTPTPADGTGRSTAVYEWADGHVRLASVLPTDLQLISNPSVVAGGGGANQRLDEGLLHGDNVISDDGRRLFFNATVQPAGGGTSLGPLLFAREDGERTRVVSAPDQPGEDAYVGTDARFWGAKRDDGSVAFFRSSTPLAGGAASNSLYRWVANAGDGETIMELSHDVDGLAPGVLGPAAISDDAKSVYFVATGVLAEDPDAEGGKPNLYLWREGQGMRHVATLDPEGGLELGVDSMMWRLDWRRTGGRAARLSADGDRLLFASYAQLDPSYPTAEDSPDACGDPGRAGDRCRQIYLYDAPSDSIRCLTCVPGVALSGDANLLGNGDARRPFRAEPRVDAPLSLPRNLSEDGTRALFETARPLVSQDQNSAVDVYEWVDRDLDGEGELHLISSGRGTEDSLFLDASTSGNDVFFTTRDRLVGIDTDDQVDLYDARVGGGIPAQNPPAPPTPCVAEACQGALSAAPALIGVGSAAGGHGDLRPGRRASFAVLRLSRSQRAKLARGRRVVLRVRVNRAGTVRLSARAKLGPRMSTVARASKRARRAGTVKLGLKLSKSARQELGRKRRLNVRLAVRFTGVREARTSTLRLTRAGSAGMRSAR